MLKKVKKKAKKLDSKAKSHAKSKTKKSRLSKKKLSKLRSKLRDTLKRSSSSTNFTHTGSDDKANSPRCKATDSARYQDCRFMENPFGALFIPPAVPKLSGFTILQDEANKNEFKKTNL